MFRSRTGRRQGKDMRIDIITIFPEVFEPFVRTSMIKRAQEKKKAFIRVHDLRAFTKDKHRKVDDRPFGGGPGMVMTPQPLFDAVKKIKGQKKARVIVTTPTGKRLDQKRARKLATEKHLIIICGHYEGIDERVVGHLADEVISIGDYILTGGELPAMVITDTVVRLIPGVLGKEASLHTESFDQNLLEYPQYTRPADFRGLKVPKVLLSGNHAAIVKWRKEQAHRLTKKLRPDLSCPDAA